ncbi:AraC family transcriptional regulator [Pseudonocardia endophytica]|uniref:AraC-like DNA-binding protein n=1 Tax=Pseudonocardia endophytica TaxID=401976 RepID=A0A4R1I121_PSEEN|nr:AraC family transcriptional regulator [Pseudonocardia endophytica]TCK27593.1 AraC-like DNA-binding protein [Pseudonocardia endophytica]
MSDVPADDAGLRATVSPDEFATSDVDHARAKLSATYYPLDLRPIGKNPTFGLQMSTVRLGPLMLGRLTYDADITKDCGELATAYHVNIPLCGDVRSTCGDEQIVSDTRTAAVFNPTGRTVLDRWSAGTTQLCLKVDSDTVQQELARRLERPLATQARFRLAMDLTSPVGRTWLHAVQLLADELDVPGGLAAQPLLAQEVRRLIVGGLLWGQAHSYSEELRIQAPPPRPRTVKLAVEAIDASPEYPWTVGELAAAAGVGIRALEDGFRRYLGETPLAYLRGVRLDLVRVELAAAGPREVAVGDVAYRWGFSHLGRFAQAYSRRFGETPSTTLRFGRS